ncbi:MAG: hypothetical protein ABJN40_12715 [Sneathiella sp.]
MRPIIIGLILGFLLASCQTNDSIEEQVSAQNYLKIANQTLLRNSMLFSIEVIRENMDLVTIMNYGMPGTPLSVLNDNKDKKLAAIRAERHRICTSKFHKPLIQKGFTFKVRLGFHKASYKKTNHQVTGIYNVPESACIS